MAETITGAVSHSRAMLFGSCRVGLLASVALGSLGYHEAMGSLQGAGKLSWNLTSGPQQRAEMKLGYMRVWNITPIF